MKVVTTREMDKALFFILGMVTPMCILLFSALRISCRWPTDTSHCHCHHHLLRRS